MSVGILVITHNDVGDALVKTAVSLVGGCPMKTEIIGIAYDSNIDKLRHEANSKLESLQPCDGVLVLTDIYGSTPSNIAMQLNAGSDTHIISGINLPMLVRIFNYPDLDVNELAEKAISGGRDGVMPYRPEKIE